MVRARQALTVHQAWLNRRLPLTKLLFRFLAESCWQKVFNNDKPGVQDETCEDIAHLQRSPFEICPSKPTKVVKMGAERL